jgi:hypothetical protein
MNWLKTETCRCFSPFGVPAVLACDDPGLLEAAFAACEPWRDTTPFVEPPIEVQLALGEDADGAAEVGVKGRRLTLEGAGISGWADAGERRARCVVPRRLAADPGVLAEAVLDPILLFLLARAGRTPVHAAGVLAGETALVLAGRSGSGKSTLALAAMARGLRILSDDTLYIQLRPSFRVWGVPRPLHVFPEIAPRFTAGTRLRGGKRKAVVPLPREAQAPLAEKAVLVVLDRGERLGLEPLAGRAALARLSRLEPGFDLLVRESAEALGALADAGAWRLTLTDDPASAIDLLCERFLGGVTVV